MAAVSNRRGCACVVESIIFHLKLHQRFIPIYARAYVILSLLSAALKDYRKLAPGQTVI
jgi:hypothetical protein